MNLCKFRLAGVVCVALFSVPAPAFAYYYNDFQGGVGGEWSRTSTSDTPTPYPFGARTFLGEFGSETVSLSLAGLPAHDTVTLGFDLYLIRSWDGSSGGADLYAFGNDLFSVGVAGGAVLLADTFSNGNPAGQTYGPNANNPYMTGAAETYSLGFVFNDGTLNISQVMDSVYRFSFDFAHDASAIQFDFSGTGLQSITDESWGLDNVQVNLGSIAPSRYVASVPEPGSLALMALGLFGLGRRRVGKRAAMI